VCGSARALPRLFSGFVATTPTTSRLQARSSNSDDIQWLFARSGCEISCSARLELKLGDVHRSAFAHDRCCAAPHNIIEVTLMIAKPLEGAAWRVVVIDRQYVRSLVLSAFRLCPSRITGHHGPVPIAVCGCDIIVF
jgi:hypothetical protein